MKFLLLKLKFIFLMQKILLHISYFIFKSFLKVDHKLWVVGVIEVANCLNHIAATFPKSYTVNLSYNKFYSQNFYNFKTPAVNTKLALLVSFFVGPVLFGYLAARADKFFYISNTGFLMNFFDGREYEFRFLKSKGKIIVNFFCGADIRSPRLSYEHGKSIGLETMVSCIELVKPGFINSEREEDLKRTASASDTFADYIFNAPVDQISYLTRDVHRFSYFYPDKLFSKNDYKFEDLSKIIIMHAPSSPVPKGTFLVRAAIKSLEMQGYEFEYIEITNSDNSVVLENLKNAHIVINELYAFMPGIFGVEAMASHCALLTSADRSIETQLPEGAEDAWLLTRYWDVEEKIKFMLDNPSEIKKYADRGYDWAYKNCRSSVSQAYLFAVLGKDL